MHILLSPPPSPGSALDHCSMARSLVGRSVRLCDRGLNNLRETNIARTLLHELREIMWGHIDAPHLYNPGLYHPLRFPIALCSLFSRNFRQCNTGTFRLHTRAHSVLQAASHPEITAVWHFCAWPCPHQHLVEQGILPPEHTRPLHESMPDHCGEPRRQHFPPARN